MCRLVAWQLEVGPLDVRNQLLTETTRRRTE
jgi:hypothetical protein